MFSHTGTSPNAAFSLISAISSRANALKGRSVLLSQAQLSDAGWVKVCTENDRPGLSLRVFLDLSRLLPLTNGNNLFFPSTSIGSHFDNTSYNMHLLFLQKYSSKSVSDGSAKKHERILFVCLFY